MKITFKIITALLLFLIVSLILTQPCFANPIVTNPHFDVSSNILIWIPSTIIEAIIVTALLWKRFESCRGIFYLFSIVVLINILTFPATQYIGWYLFFGISHQAVYLAELFPLIAESLLLKLLFYFLYKHGDISTPVSWKRTVLIALISNVVTFALGLLTSHYFPVIWS